MAYHPFSGKQYRWDKVCKTLTSLWIGECGWVVKEEPEVFRHDLVMKRGGEQRILEVEARNDRRFDMVWSGAYDEVHAPARRFTLSDSDAEWVISYPMGVLDGDRRVYRVPARYVKEAFEAGHIETVPTANMGWDDDTFVLVSRIHYEFLEIPERVWNKWHGEFSGELFKMFAV